MAKRNQVEQSKRVLEAAGFEVRRRADWVKHSFEVDRQRLQTLREVASRRDMKLKEAVDQALTEWLEKWGGGSAN